MNRKLVLVLVRLVMWLIGALSFDNTMINEPVHTLSFQTHLPLRVEYIRIEDKALPAIALHVHGH